ncbi:hypothetical protein B0H11DRAFT_1944739 [Mycena galericulata]|nr:hypothetical protein B0H11DRAFT_1944739 [Mycena galericulata]
MLRIPWNTDAEVRRAPPGIPIEIRNKGDECTTEAVFEVTLTFRTAYDARGAHHGKRDLNQREQGGQTLGVDVKEAIYNGIHGMARSRVERGGVSVLVHILILGTAALCPLPSGFLLNQRTQMDHSRSIVCDLWFRMNLKLAAPAAKEGSRNGKRGTLHEVRDIEQRVRIRHAENHSAWSMTQAINKGKEKRFGRTRCSAGHAGELKEGATLEEFEDCGKVTNGTRRGIA